jgi:chromosome segregation ATPase
MSEELNAWKIDCIRQCQALWEIARNPGQVAKTPIAEQDFLLEAFEKKVSALEAELKTRLAEILAEKKMLVQANERLAGQTEILTAALAAAEMKIGEQGKRISSLKKQITFQLQALTKAKRRTAGAERDHTPSPDP